MAGLLHLSRGVAVSPASITLSLLRAGSPVVCRRIFLHMVVAIVRGQHVWRMNPTDLTPMRGVKRGKDCVSP